MHRPRCYTGSRLALLRPVLWRSRQVDQLPEEGRAEPLGWSTRIRRRGRSEPAAGKAEDRTAPGLPRGKGWTGRRGSWLQRLGRQTGKLPGRRPAVSGMNLTDFNNAGGGKQTELSG